MLYASEFLGCIHVPHRSPEPHATFLQYPKSRQDELKDAAGGYVGGALAGNRRKAASITGRDIITLDLDNIPPGGTADVLRRLEGLACWYAVHSTRKHEEARPRLRVFFVPVRTLSADEYEPVARKMGQLIGIELCDPSTFEIGRLMFFPTCSADSQYVFRYGDKPFLNPDGILNMYTNWRDVREWPQVPGAEQTHVRLAAKQEDPTSKSGVIGAFCRCYDVYEAMGVFLPDAYTPIDDGNGRFTFTGGSTAGGAVVYDGGKFLFSHHATDPAGGKLVNSFDLVRFHKFHELDDDAKPDTPVNKLPSFAAMQELALKDSKVSELLNRERYEEISRDFGDLADDATGNASEVTDGAWMSLLQRNQSTGQFLKSIRNVQIVLQSDPLLRDRIYKDAFADQLMGVAPLPWGARRKETGAFKWSDDDDDGLLVYMDRLLNIQGLRTISSALRDHAAANQRNPAREYFDSLQWDGQPRLDTLYVDYLGAEDCAYTRAVTRKAFVAAVARVMEADGVKFDSMTVVCGPQNLGKSTLFRKMGKQWFTDSVKSFEHKEAEELIQGKLIVEIAELQAFNRVDINRVKGSRQQNDVKPTLIQFLEQKMRNF